MTLHRKHRRTTTIVGALTLTVTLAACGEDGPETDEAADGAEDGEGGTITLGFLPSWTDSLSTAYLLEEQGYTLELQELSEAAPLYAGLAGGDIDIEDLGTYYDEAKLTFAVPEYTDIDSIEDLVVNENPEDPAAGVEAWMEEYPDVLPSMD